VILIVGGIFVVRRHERHWMELAEQDAAAWALARPHGRPRRR